MSPILETEAINEKITNDVIKEKPFKADIVWRNVILFSVLHVGALYGMILLFTAAKWQTWLWIIFLYQAGAMGITAGAHRLWTHKSYKAKLPARLILLLFNTMALQNDVIEWSRDHRVHHKYTETDADPHNSKRGFFFCHIGWLLVRKHPEVKDKGAKLDISDLTNDPLLAFQKKYYKILSILFCFIIPSVVPWYFWSENLTVSYFAAGLFRYCFLLHATWSVNSFAHMYGYKPYDKKIKSSENFVVSALAAGEGWHNYHHTFPHDYKTSEFGWKINFTTMFIDLMASLGWVYDRKTVSHDAISRQKLKHGHN